MFSRVLFRSIAFLDFGIMGRLDDRTRLVLRRALPALLVDGDFATVVRAVFDLGAATEPVDLAQATADVRDLLEPIATKPLAEISYGELLGHILRVATRYHVVLQRGLVPVVLELLYRPEERRDGQRGVRTVKTRL